MGNNTFMKLSKIFLTVGLGALAIGGTSALIAANSHKVNEQPALASAEDGYTTYYSGDLGFATRDPNDTRVVLGDADHGEQAVGTAVLAEKSEQIFSFKKTRSNYWMGVGGYAIYVSSDTTIRFLYLSHSTSGNYGRNIEVTNLVLKTADGATELTSVTGDDKLFTNYTTAVIRFDLSNPSAVKAHFHVIFNGVEYYTFSGSTLIDTVTYTHQCSGFDSSYLNKAMCGYNGTTGGLSVIKFETYDEIKNLNSIITAPTATVFDYNYIGDFFFDFHLSEQIFTKTGYFNDHLTGRYTNVNGQNIDLANGIIINGKTFGYWVNYTDSGMTFMSNDGVHCFPVKNGGVFSPVSIEVTATTIAFKVNANYLPMDSFVITFKAGVFAGFNSGIGTHGTTYQLSEDLTFYSTLEDSDATAINNPSSALKIVRSTNETVHTDYKFTDVSDNGLKTNAHGHQYYQYTLWTNIPRNTNVNCGWTQDHYRHFYNNILLNGKPLSWYNSWARGNSKDATEEYETKHATGSANPTFDMAIQLQSATDQANYVMWIYFPVQLVTDLGLGTPIITLKDGAAWLTPSGVIRINCSPEDRYATEKFVEDNMHLGDYTSEQGYCKDNEHHYYLTAKVAFNALTSGQKVAFQNAGCFADAKERFEAWAVANSDAHPYDGNDSIQSTTGIYAINGSNDIAIIITVMTFFVSISLLGFVLFRKTKQN